MGSTVVSIFESLIPISFFALIVLIVYFTARFRYRLKMAIIEKGGTLDFKKSRFPYVEVGITVSAIGIGIIIPFFAHMAGMNEEYLIVLLPVSVLLTVISLFVRLPEFKSFGLPS